LGKILRYLFPFPLTQVAWVVRRLKVYCIHPLFLSLHQVEYKLSLTVGGDGCGDRFWTAVVLTNTTRLSFHHCRKRSKRFSLVR
jgi:hypothetical protein